MVHAQSKGTWGKRQERTEQELNKLCGDSFRALKLPLHWKFERYDKIRLQADDTSEIQSIGAWFHDTRTKGQELKRYRIWFGTYSERLGLVERSVVDISRFKELALVSNLTAEAMNEFLGELVVCS